MNVLYRQERTRLAKRLHRGSPSTTDLAKQAAWDAGFDLVGCSPPTLLPHIEEALSQWLNNGYAGNMSYLTRDGAARANPLDRWPDLKTVMCLGLNYYSPRPAPPQGKRVGRVAAYAYGRDYHKVIEKRLKTLSGSLQTLLGADTVIKSYVDTGPILERAFAAQAGLGFIGKNTNLISQLFGSWIFLSTLLLNVKLEFDQPVKVSCGTCTKCLDACPTHAFPSPYTLDATQCIAYHTIESKAPVPVPLAQQFGDWSFGCDICQEVCPFTKFAQPTTVEEFRPPDSQGFESLDPSNPQSAIGNRQSKAGAWLDLDELARMNTNDEFRERYQGTPIIRGTLQGLKRFL